MARQSTIQHPGNWAWNGDSDEYFARTDKLFKALYEKSQEVARNVEISQAAGKDIDLTGFLMKFPAADGYAYYLVSKDTPLTLQHVPIGDAWQIPAAHLRGIKRRDVLQQIKQALFWDSVKHT